MPSKWGNITLTAYTYIFVSAQEGAEKAAAVHKFGIWIGQSGVTRLSNLSDICIKEIHVSRTDFYFL